MRRSIAALVLIAVALAGCNGPLLGESGPPTETVTPVAVAEPTATDGPGDENAGSAAGRPAGIGADGLANVSTLAEAHDRALRNRSFTVALRSNQTVGAAGVVSDSRQTVRVANDSVFRVREVDEGFTSEFYVEGTDGYNRRTTGNASSVRYVRQPELNATGLYASMTSGYVETYLPERAEAVAAERDGRTFYRIHAIGPPRSLERDVLVPIDNVSNYSATAWVAPTGVVRALAVEYDYDSDGRRIHVTFRMDVRDVNATSVDRPDWARASNGTATAAPTEGPGSNGTATETPVAGENRTETDGENRLGVRD